MLETLINIVMVFIT